MRQNGFYWVKSYGKWLVSEWDGSCWGFPQYSGKVVDSDLEEIHEIRLTPPA